MTTYPAKGAGNLWKMNGRWMYRIGKSEGGRGYLGGVGEHRSKAKARHALDKLIRARKLKLAVVQERKVLTPKVVKKKATNGTIKLAGKKRTYHDTKPRLFKSRPPHGQWMWTYRPEKKGPAWRGSTGEEKKADALKVLEQVMKDLNTTGTTTFGKCLTRNGVTPVPGDTPPIDVVVKKMRKAIPNAGVDFAGIIDLTVVALEERMKAEHDFLKQLKSARKQFGH